MRFLSFATVVLFAFACGPPTPGAGPPAPTPSTVRVMDYQAVEFLTEALQTSATLPATSVEVWAVLPGVYEQLGIPVTESSEGRRTLGNAGFRTRNLDGKRVSRYVDCGRSNSGALANIYDVTLTISTSVADAPDGGATVSTTVDAWARPRMTNGNPVHCSSKTTLEQRLVELVTEKVGGERAAAGVPPD